MHLLDFDSGQQRGKIEWTRKERPACCGCRFTPDGMMLVLADEEGGLTLWETASRQELLKYKLPDAGIEAIDVSPDGKLISGVNARRHLRLAVACRRQAGEAARE